MASIQKRTSKDGKVTHRVLVRLKGYPTETATFERLTDARNWAQKTEAAMKERRYFKDSEAKKHTVAEAIDRYLQGLERTNPKRWCEVKPMLEWWKKEIGYCLLSDLTKRLLSQKIESLATHKRKLSNGLDKPRSPARVNRYVSTIRHVFTVALNDWEWLESHPLQKINRFTNFIRISRHLVMMSRDVGDEGVADIVLDKTGGHGALRELSEYLSAKIMSGNATNSG